MFRVDLICLTNSGIRQIRMSTTRDTMDRPQAHPVSGPKIAPVQLVELDDDPGDGPGDEAEQTGNRVH